MEMTAGSRNASKGDLFPPFIPDDPEMPHLSSSIKERERRAVIMSILRELLRHNKSDWTDEIMKSMPSMFDD